MSSIKLRYEAYVHRCDEQGVDRWDVVWSLTRPEFDSTLTERAEAGWVLDASYEVVMSIPDDGVAHEMDRHALHG